jgi:hypothetical protein
MAYGYPPVRCQQSLRRTLVRACAGTAYCAPLANPRKENRDVNAAASEGARRISQKRTKTREMVTADGKYSLVIFNYFMRGRHLYFMHIVRLKIERIKL